MINPASPSLRLFLVVALTLLAALAFASLGSTSGAGPFVVTKTADTADGACDTDCSLREAIIAASPGDTIEFHGSLAGQTITLTSGELYISKNLTIAGLAGGITVSGNNSSAVFHVGGGVTVGFSYLTVSGGNSGNTVGGGIYNSGTLNLTNSTVSGNTAGSGGGGGIGNTGSAILNLTNSTVSGNTAANVGGGIFNDTDIAVTLTNSIVANQVSGANCAGSPFTSAGHNLDSDGSCNLTATGDLPSTDPMLAPLALNQPGTTETHAIQLGSPAINAGDDNACPATDQRGVARPQSSHCDIGAYEATGVDPTPTPGAFAKGDVDCSGRVNSVDSLKILRKVAELSVQQSEPCTDIGGSTAFAVSADNVQGDINCDDNVTSVDALLILRFVAELNVNLPPSCSLIGSG